jgi:hypothetical protein
MGSEFTEFDVFYPDGRRLGRIATGLKRDSSLKPRVVGEQMYLVATDELGIPFVQALRLDKLAGR